MSCSKCQCQNDCTLVHFAKSSTTDAFNPKNQDCITKNLALSRLPVSQISSNGILFNPKKETLSQINNNTSPLNTLWTIGSWDDVKCHLDNVDWVKFNNLQYFFTESNEKLSQLLTGNTVILYSTLDNKYYQITFVVYGNLNSGNTSEVVYKRCKCSLSVPEKFKNFIPTEFVAL